MELGYRWKDRAYGRISVGEDPEKYKNRKAGSKSGLAYLGRLSKVVGKSI